MVHIVQAFFCTLLKKLNHEKNSKNRVQEKNSAKFCPKTQPTAGFSLLKNYKKTPFMKKTGIFAPKTQFFPFKTQCTAGLRPELSCRKVYKKKPALGFFKSYRYLGSNPFCVTIYKRSTHYSPFLADFVYWIHSHNRTFLRDSHHIKTLI